MLDQNLKKKKKKKKKKTRLKYGVPKHLLDIHKEKQHPLGKTSHARYDVKIKKMPPGLTFQLEQVSLKPGK